MRRFQFRLSTIIETIAIVAVLLGCVIAWQRMDVSPHRATDDVVKSVLDARRASKRVSSVDLATIAEIALAGLAVKVLFDLAWPRQNPHIFTQPITPHGIRDET